MLQIVSFFLKCIADFIKMLFKVSLDYTLGLSFGSFFCICFIFLPMVLRVANFLKQYATDALLDDFEKSENKRRRK